MPSTAAGLFQYAIATVIMVAIGVAILSRTPVWKFIVGAPK